MRILAATPRDWLRRAALLAIVASAGCSDSGSKIVDPNARVAFVSVAPATFSVNVGGTKQLTAGAYDSAGRELAGRAIAWSSNATAIATVSAAGLVSGVAPGSASIVATVDGKADTALVTVTSGSTSTGTVTINATQEFQTMTGWEALAEIGQAECDPRAYQTYKSGLLDRAANEVGINRIRLGLRNGYENPVDWYAAFKSGQLTFNQWKAYWFQVVNDNADPLVINAAGFNWGYLDYTVEELILPLKQRLQARGDDLWFNLSYTGANSGQLHRDNPNEYAEFVLAAFQHLQQKYGLVPNSLELVNEPNLGGWQASVIGQNLLAVKQRLNQAGFFPDFVGPSASTVSSTLTYVDQLLQVPGAAAALDEIAYHRYGTAPTAGQLQALAQRGAQHGLRTAMLEHIGSGHEDLHADLTQANVSAWQQFGLAFCNEQDGGGLYFTVFGAALGSNSPVVHTGAITRFLRQYFRYVPLGAVRVGAASTEPAWAPVAFRNPNGKFTVVVKASAAGTFTVGGLPAGRYGIDYTTASEYMQTRPDVTITSTQALTASIPAPGVITIFSR